MTQRFNHYKNDFSDCLVMDRSQGIVTLRMHHEGGPAQWNWSLHRALPRAFEMIGSDPENEVLIVTGTGGNWIESIDPEMSTWGERNYDQTFYDAAKLVESLVFGLDIPTIAAMSGLARVHPDIGLMCDITICSDDASFQDTHFTRGAMSGDGLGLALQVLLGAKRAAYYMFTGMVIGADVALTTGLVSEIVPSAELGSRAAEIAASMMSQPRITRRLMSQVARHPWQRAVVEDYRIQLAYQFYSKFAQ